MQKPTITKKYNNLSRSKRNVDLRQRLQNSGTNGIFNNMNMVKNTYDGKGGAETMPNFNLTQGIRGEDVRTLQQWLINNKFLNPGEADGIFGPITQAALNAYNTEKNTSSTTSATSKVPPTVNNAYKYLIRFTDDPNSTLEGGAGSIWMVDDANKVIVPFVSQQAFNEWYGSNAEEAWNSINDKSSATVNPGMEYGNFALLGPEYGIKPGKQQKKMEFSPKQIMNRYGQIASDEKTSIGTMQLDGWLNYLSTNLDSSGLNQQTIDNIKNDPLTMAAYIGAVTYGGYQMDDIYMDLKRKELVAGGDTSMKDYTPINLNYLKKDYITNKSNGGVETYAALSPLVPANIGSLQRAEFSSASLPNSFFRAVFPTYFNVDSPEFKQKMSEVTSLSHDSILQSMEATTIDQKEAADFAWKNTRDQIEQKYGISLSDNALTAWGELETLQSNASEAGLAGSGIANEKLQEMLALRRTQGDRLRDQKAQDLLSTNNTYYTSKASPEEIRTLSNEEAAKLGVSQLKTGVDFNSWLSAWRTKYPNGSNMSDAEVKAKYYSPTYDDNGNKRSTLFQTEFDNKFKTTYGYDPVAIPAESLREYQYGIAAEKTAAEIAGKDEGKNPSYDVITSTTPRITDTSGTNVGTTGTTQPPGEKITGIIDPSKKTYFQAGTGAQLTAEQIKAGNFPAGTQFTESGTGRQVTSENIGSIVATDTIKEQLKKAQEIKVLETQQQSMGSTSNQPISSSTPQGSSIVSTPKITIPQSLTMASTPTATTKLTMAPASTAKLTIASTSTPSSFSNLSSTIKSSTPKYTNLSDYYTKQGKSFSAWNSPERLALAKSAGINSGYTGSGDQNKIILDYLNK